MMKYDFIHLENQESRLYLVKSNLLYNQRYFQTRSQSLNSGFWLWEYQITKKKGGGGGISITIFQDPFIIASTIINCRKKRKRTAWDYVVGHFLFSLLSFWNTDCHLFWVFWYKSVKLEWTESSCVVCLILTTRMECAFFPLQ